MNNLEWSKECQYISDLTWQALCGKIDGELALRYAKLQADNAEKQGFHDAHEYIMQCLDDMQNDDIVNDIEKALK